MSETDAMVKSHLLWSQDDVSPISDSIVTSCVRLGKFLTSPSLTFLMDKIGKTTIVSSCDCWGKGERMSLKE